MAALVAVSLLCGCASEPVTKENASTSSGKSDSKAEEGDTTDNPVEEGQGNDATKSQLSGESLFQFSVLSAFQSQCIGCHADPRFAVETRGPLTIFNYLYMKPMVKDGSSVDNALLRKMQGINHTGGNQCPQGLQAPPCSYVVEWYKAEFGDDQAVAKFVEDTSNADARPGHISDITSLGKVFGWAVDKSDLTQALTIRLYADGDATTGVLVATQLADRVGYDGNHSGHHQFMVELPEDLRDGESHSLYLYGEVAGSDELMAGPVSFHAYNYSDAGRAYYNETVLPLVAQCKECHSTTYEGHFANLLSPTPSDGATASANELINKASGQNHGGGNRCATGSPCNELRTWWTLEFE